MTEQLSGRIVPLEIIAQEGSRWVLQGPDEHIMMNMSEAAEDVAIGDVVDIFLYVNRRKELTATMTTPTVTMDSFGWATVIRVDPTEGVYVDIGASFEVLINGADLPQIKKLWPQIGDALYMTLRTDLGGGIFGRLATEERVMEEITHADAKMHNANLTARPYRLLPVGTFLLSIPENYRIFVHETERKQEPRLGELLTVRIIDVHEDGTMNGSLLPRIEERLSADAETIYNYLQEVGGKMPFTDKSTPDEIREMFNMSKGAFKRALGGLMKGRKITQADGWTTLTED